MTTQEVMATSERPWGSYAVRFLAVVALGLLIYYALGKIDWPSLGAALAHARLSLIALAAALNFVHIACKSERWRLQLEPLARVSGRKLYHYLLSSYAASIILPARAGEALRVLVLKRRHGVTATASVGVIVSEKLFELLGLLAVVAPLPLLLELPRFAKWSLAAVAGLGIVCSAVLIGLALSKADLSASFIGRLAQGLRTASSPRAFSAALGWSIAAYLLDGVEIWLILLAVGVQVPWATCGLVLLTLNLAIAVPSTPGQVGAFEAGAVVGLTAMNVPLEPALAFALIYHVMQVVPVLLAGVSGVSLLKEAKS